MSILTFTILLTIIFYAVVKYGEHTTKQSLIKRYELVECINKIDKSQNKLIHKISIQTLYDSMDKNLLPKLIWSFFLYSIKSNAKKIKINEAYNQITKQQKDKNTFNQLTKKMLEVNILNSIHWYIFFGLIASSIALIYLIFKQFGKIENPISLLSKIEFLSYQTIHNQA